MTISSLHREMDRQADSIPGGHGDEVTFAPLPKLPHLNVHAVQKQRVQKTAPEEHNKILVPQADQGKMAKVIHDP